MSELRTEAVDIDREDLRLLEMAVERGYFEVPRRTTLSDIATEHGTDSAVVSRRLRRTLSTVLSPTVETLVAERRKSGDDESAGPDGVPESDTVFSALGNTERRRVCYYLREHDAADVDELAEILAGYRAGESGPVTAEEYEDIAGRLRETHLPALSEADLVAYDREDDSARLAPLVAPVEGLLEASLRLDTASAVERNRSSPPAQEHDELSQSG